MCQCLCPHYFTHDLCGSWNHVFHVLWLTVETVETIEIAVLLQYYVLETLKGSRCLILNQTCDWGFDSYVRHRPRKMFNAEPICVVMGWRWWRRLSNETSFWCVCATVDKIIMLTSLVSKANLGINQTAWTRLVNNLIEFLCLFWGMNRSDTEWENLGWVLCEVLPMWALIDWAFNTSNDTSLSWSWTNRRIIGFLGHSIGHRLTSSLKLQLNSVQS